MGEENTIPLNNELLTVAKISDLESISTNYSLTDIAAVLITNDSDINSMFDRDLIRLTNIVSIMNFFRDTELVTDDFKQHASRVVDILNLFKDGVSLSDTNISTLKSSLGFIYAELVDFGQKSISLQKSITFSLVDKELEDALFKVSSQPYANIARLNSLLYRNTNSLIYIDKIMSLMVFNINREISKLDVMIDMCKVTKAHSIFSLVSTASVLRDDNRVYIKSFIDNKFIDSTCMDTTKLNYVDTTISDSELLNTINTIRENIKVTYSTLKLNKILDMFNFDLNNLYDNTSVTLFSNAEFKESLFKIKYDMDILTELICSITDSINDSVDKLRKSIPISSNEIDNIDTI